jgi:zinc-binding alcohol dehydrogenase family protein
MSDTMRAFGAVGGLPIEDPASFVDLELSVPRLRSRDVLVRVQAVSVNPVDTKVRASMAPGEAPRVLGFDAAGVVEAIGREVRTLGVGDEVWYAGAFTRQGSNAELQAVDERIVAERPGTLNFAQAAALPLTAITAWESLFDRLRLERDSIGTLLVIGGAGGVGSILIQLATHIPGLRVIATASRQESRDWVAGLGAHAVIDHHDLVNEGLQAAPDGVDYVFSTHSEGNVEAFAQLMNPFGHVVAIDDPEGLDLRDFKPKSIAWHWEFMFTRPMFETDDIQEHKRLLARVAALVDEGRVRTTVTETIEDFSAAGLRRAHALVESGRMTGKVVVTR